MRIHCLQHVAFESPGTIIEWAAQHGHTITYTYFFEQGRRLPLLTEFDALLIMGGYMNVDEEAEFPWLKEEKTFISQSIAAGKKLLGICLGAQLIAAAMGARVYKGKEKEIGFLPLQFPVGKKRDPLLDHFADEYLLFHWHGDSFDLPADAQLLASTTACKHQAFTVGNNVLALQFHPEMNEDTIEQMLLHDGKELEEKGIYIQSVEAVRNGYVYLERNKRDLFVLLDKFFNSSPNPFSIP